MGTDPLEKTDLRGKKVAVITDDWGRPTPAHEVVPLIVDTLRAAGAADDDMTFLTASGMHDPMSEADLIRKLGEPIVRGFRTISHDAGDRTSMECVGITRQGTPIWVNRYVAEADFTLALGRIHPHESHGYEGGYKMVLPGVTGFDTITRDHAFNFSPESVVGVLENPSREETDAVGAMVGIDFLIDVVVTDLGEPVEAFSGETMAVHHAGVEYGDREVWGAEVGEPGDVVVVSPGSGQVPTPYRLETLYRAARVTAPTGTLIGVTSEPTEMETIDGDAIADDSLLALDADRFVAKLPTLAFSEIVRLHEARRWRLDERTIQWRLKSVRGEFYRRRKVGEILARNAVLTPDPNTALRDALGRFGPDARVIVVPEGTATLPKQTLFVAQR